MTNPAAFAARPYATKSFSARRGRSVLSSQFAPIRIQEANVAVSARVCGNMMGATSDEAGGSLTIGCSSALAPAFSLVSTHCQRLAGYEAYGYSGRILDWHAAHALPGRSAVMHNLPSNRG
jgi:hypothetical protein